MPLRSTHGVLSMKPIITHRQEEMLSYMTGLAPVGSPLQIRHKWIAQDFNWMDHSLFAQIVKSLIRLGCVELVKTGRSYEPSWHRVLLRPEQCISADGSRVQRLRYEQREAA